MAALAILESPSPDEFRSEYAMLAAGVASMANRSRGFRTSFFPAERDGENWNFYSGEALLFWAEARRRGAPGAPSLALCMETFRIADGGIGERATPLSSRGTRRARARRRGGADSQATNGASVPCKTRPLRGVAVDRKRSAENSLRELSNAPARARRFRAPFP